MSIWKGFVRHQVSGQQTDQKPNRKMKSCSNVSSAVGEASQRVGIAVLIRMFYTHQGRAPEATMQYHVCADAAW